MENDLIFISDLLIEQSNRGAELNDSVLIEKLDIKNRILCRDLKKVDPEKFYIIGNFVTLPENIKNQLIQYENYIIYEHDHKYIKSRNPFLYSNGIVPNSELINVNFYKSAKSIICLTDWHENQLRQNLGDFKDITNIHGSLWSDKDLSLFKTIANIRKNSYCAIYSGASNPRNFGDTGDLKNTEGAINYCIDNNIKYKLIPRMKSREKFLRTLGKFNSLAFFPKIPESCSRLLTEAKMMGLNIYSNNNSGAANEYWWKYQGVRLIDEFSDKITPNAIKIFKDRL